MTCILRKTKDKPNFTSNRFCVKFVFFHYVFMKTFDKGPFKKPKFNNSKILKNLWKKNLVFLLNLNKIPAYFITKIYDFPLF
jgi:hypothetical protein